MYLEEDKEMGIYPHKMTIKSSRMTWRFVWGLNIIISAIAAKFGYSIIYWISGYLYIGGIISFVYALRKYAELDTDCVRLYIGPFYKKEEVKISWKSIKNIAFTRVRKKWKTAIHGVDTGLNAPHQEDEEGVLVELKNKIEAMHIIENNKTLKEKLMLPNEEYFVFLSDPPEGGFRSLIKMIKKYSSDGISIQYGELNNKKSNYYQYIYIDWVIGTLSTVMFACSTWRHFGVAH